MGGGVAYDNIIEAVETFNEEIAASQ